MWWDPRCSKRPKAWDKRDAAWMLKKQEMQLSGFGALRREKRKDLWVISIWWQQLQHLGALCEERPMRREAGGPPDEKREMESVSQLMAERFMHVRLVFGRKQFGNIEIVAREVKKWSLRRTEKEVEGERVLLKQDEERLTVGFSQEISLTNHARCQEASTPSRHWNSFRKFRRKKKSLLMIFMLNPQQRSSSLGIISTRVEGNPAPALADRFSSHLGSHEIQM